MKCPICKKEITFVDFCGDAYYGSYDLGSTTEYTYTCPKCKRPVFKIPVTIPEEKTS